MKGDFLLIGVHSGLHPERQDATRLCMANIQVAHDRQIRIIYDGNKQLFIFLMVDIIHRFPNEHAVHRVKNALLLQDLQCLFILLPSASSPRWYW